MRFKNVAPDCICQDGYYLNSTNFECEKCPDRFSTCENPGRGTCKLSDRITEKCVCQEGFYHVSDQQACLPCEYPCKTCMSQSYCLKCVDSLNRNLQNCSCKAGYYKNQDNECQLCEIENCKQCNQNGECEECLNGDLLPPLCKKQKSGFFLEELDSSGSTIVLQCSKRCEACENSMEECSQCSIGQFRNSEPPCLCLDGYHDNSGNQQQCNKCPSGCKLCENQDRCLECENNSYRELNNFTGRCECEKGSTEDLKTKQCIRCYSYNSKCHISCPQSTYADENLFVCIDRNFVIQDNVLLIILSSLAIIIAILGQLLLYKVAQKRFDIQKNRYITDQAVQQK